MKLGRGKTFTPVSMGTGERNVPNDRPVTDGSINQVRALSLFYPLLYPAVVMRVDCERGRFVAHALPHARARSIAECGALHELVGNDLLLRQQALGVKLAFALLAVVDARAVAARQLLFGPRRCHA